MECRGVVSPGLRPAKRTSSWLQRFGNHRRQANPNWQLYSGNGNARRAMREPHSTPDGGPRRGPTTWARETLYQQCKQCGASRTASLSRARPSRTRDIKHNACDHGRSADRLCCHWSTIKKPRQPRGSPTSQAIKNRLARPRLLPSRSAGPCSDG